MTFVLLTNVNTGVVGRSFSGRRGSGASGFNFGAVLVVTVTADVSTLTMNVNFTVLPSFGDGVLCTVLFVNIMAFVLSTVKLGVNTVTNRGLGDHTRFLNNTVLVLVKLGVLLRRLNIVGFWVVGGGRYFN